MAVELTDDVSNLEETLNNPQTRARSCPTQLRMSSGGVERKVGRAYVFHGSKEANWLLSTRRRCCLERTRLPFPFDEKHTRCYDLWTGLAERAICEGSRAIGHLRGWMRFALMQLEDNGRLIWSTSLAVCCATSFASFPSTRVMVKRCFSK